MKHIKKQIEDEHTRIADMDRDFLENEIYKRINENIAAQKVQRKGIRRLIVSAAALCVISAVIIGSVFVIKRENNYLDNYETKKSDIEQVNVNLTNTQFVGDFSVKERRYALKKRALKRWIYLHGYTQREIAKKLHMSTKKFKRKLAQKKVFNVEQICRLVYLMGAWNAFHVIYFPTFKERSRVYNEVFGKKCRNRRKQTEYGRSKKVGE